MDIIAPTEVAAPAGALGGLMIPNIPFWQWLGTAQKKNVGSVLLTTWSKTNEAFCWPEAKVEASAVLLQTVSADDLVTVCGPAPHMKRTVSPTDALTANGT